MNLTFREWIEENWYSLCLGVPYYNKNGSVYGYAAPDMTNDGKHSLAHLTSDQWASLKKRYQEELEICPVRS